MTLTELIKTRDWGGMHKYVCDRYEMGVSYNHAAEILIEIAQHHDPNYQGEGCLEVRLKDRLKKLGYLEPMFTGRDDDPKVTWNELHIFVDQPYESNPNLMPDPSGYAEALPDAIPGREVEPKYVRSKLAIYGEKYHIKPINKTTQSVAPYEEIDEQ